MSSAGKRQRGAVLNFERGDEVTYRKGRLTFLATVLDTWDDIVICDSWFEGIKHIPVNEITRRNHDKPNQNTGDKPDSKLDERLLQFRATLLKTAGIEQKSPMEKTTDKNRG